MKNRRIAATIVCHVAEDNAVRILVLFGSCGAGFRGVLAITLAPARSSRTLQARRPRILSTTD